MQQPTSFTWIMHALHDSEPPPGTTGGLAALEQLTQADMLYRSLNIYAVQSIKSLPDWLRDGHRQEWDAFGGYESILSAGMRARSRIIIDQAHRAGVPKDEILIAAVDRAYFRYAVEHLTTWGTRLSSTEVLLAMLTRINALEGLARHPFQPSIVEEPTHDAMGVVLGMRLLESNPNLGYEIDGRRVIEEEIHRLPQCGLRDVCLAHLERARIVAAIDHQPEGVEA